MTSNEDDFNNQQVNQLVTENNDRIEALKNLISKVDNLNLSDNEKKNHEENSITRTTNSKE